MFYFKIKIWFQNRRTKWKREYFSEWELWSHRVALAGNYSHATCSSISHAYQAYINVSFSFCCTCSSVSFRTSSNSSDTFVPASSPSSWCFSLWNSESCFWFTVTANCFIIKRPNGQILQICSSSRLFPLIVHTNIYTYTI